MALMLLHHHCRTLLLLGGALLWATPVFAHDEHFPEAPALVPVQMVSLQDAKEQFNQGELFIDTRSTAEWEAERIAIASHMSWEEHTITRDSMRDLAPSRDTPIILYGNNPRGPDLRQVMYLLTQKLGYTHVRVLDASFSDWVKHDYPVE